MTTTIGLKFKEGVILAADSQATMGHMISDKDIIKIEKIYGNTYMTLAGGVADNQYLLKVIPANLRSKELKNGAKIKVRDIVNLLSILLFRYRGAFQVGPIIGGYDDKPRLFSFDALGSIIEKEDFCSTGSGSIFAYGVLESNYKPNLNEKEGKELAIKAIKAAKERDVYSGGNLIKLVIIKKDKVTEEIIKEK